MFQQTIKKSITITGIGAHSGLETSISLIPAVENHGIIFKRIDLPSSENIIPALWSYVTDTRLCTKISNTHRASISTIEHLMAALAAKKIDNLLIEINGAEVPILDGSAQPFLEALEQVEIITQKSPRNYLRVLKAVSASDGDRWAQINPSLDQFSLEYTFRNRGTNALETYNSSDALRDFENDLSSARTFGFLEDVEKLYAAGLAKGSSLRNAVVFDKDKVLNPEGLRFSDECARHKALDVVGDLYLAGLPIIGHFEGYCSGHSLNNDLLRKLLNDRSAWIIESSGAPKRFPTHIPQKSTPSREQMPRFGTY